ncbi:unnamed protein product [Polarella glacialis]|uniref:Uncharacterized protein n=1 Tax=Polarella glacialis TaxID=89957 RepID=A0A813LJJ2_POLGL|nr:unnamed protein product [Polarella glacialis]CAE8730493.1 unnamed protein product [Polarella glacialis]|mmetsp:Transcript_1375/g.2143  ORF Transcript_1375/g.2143 Transcript_1375/m.2143 type:complete len:134 (+) Transcript_1375:75-476(+)|eukprot:CAMPEP_0115063096 /NCGR_PEP_ID=MMETSP0227-20121206/8920_1 /TAXON_ID=89957 /ORGANISM="Polarella glacialis, Strain CCMP 1383" /LENGTH=133 /DNA_ID=CAMNT_0002448565 /DNA_START=68 /DNA_END=469 /DNA_ORIENTATION=-
MASGASGWADADESIGARITASEAAIHRLQDELVTVLDGLGALREQVRAAEDMAGDPQSDRLCREVSDVLKTQVSALEEMVRATQGFPRRWARLEVNTSQRKSLMLSVKARRRRDHDELGDLGQLGLDVTGGP